MVCILAKDPVIATSPAYHDHPPQQLLLNVPDTIIATGPEYGLAVLKGADPRALDLALFVLSPDGQQIFSDYGFAPMGLPAPER